MKVVLRKMRYSKQSGPGRLPGQQVHFREAMIKPTTVPEFKDNVVAVKTEVFWDDALVEDLLVDGPHHLGADVARADRVHAHAIGGVVQKKD